MTVITCVLRRLVNRKMLDDDTLCLEQAQIIHHYSQGFDAVICLDSTTQILTPSFRLV